MTITLSGGTPSVKAIVVIPRISAIDVRPVGGYPFDALGSA